MSTDEPTPARRATIIDVAREAGVSRQTVVRALHNQGRISPETRERVIRAAADLQYEPNRAAQALVGASTRTIALVLGDLRNPFYAELTEALRKEADHHGYAVMLPRRPSGDVHELARQLSSLPIDGVALFPHMQPPDLMAPLIRATRRAVVIGAEHEFEGCSEIRFDDQGAVELLPRFIGTPDPATVGLLSYVGSSGLEHPRIRLVRQRYPGPVQVADTLSSEAGYDAAEALVRQHPSVRTIIAFCDALALGAIRAIQDRGQRVPDDRRIVSFDGTRMAQQNSPSIASIGFDIPRLAGLVLDRLLARDDSSAVLPAHAYPGASAPSASFDPPTGDPARPSPKRR